MDPQEFLDRFIVLAQEFAARYGLPQTQVDLAVQNVEQMITMPVFREQLRALGELEIEEMFDTLLGSAP